MVAPYKTPGVYIVDQNAFSPSIVAVPTAVPAFVGHTAQASFKGQSLTGTPFRVKSMSEFIAAFGGPPPVAFKIDSLAAPSSANVKPAAAPGMSASDTPSEAKLAGCAPTPTAAVNAGSAGVATLASGVGDDRDQFCLTPVGTQYLLYQSMLLFFQNGGGPCWIVSVGNFGDQITTGDTAIPNTLLFGLEKLKTESEPTIVVIPDAVRLHPGQCSKVQQQMLAHCGEVMKNRFAILDIVHGDQGLQAEDKPVDTFRNNLGPNNLDYGAAYFPWLNTTLVADTDISYRYFIDPADAGSATRLINVVRHGLPNGAIDPSVEAMITSPLTGNPDEQARQVDRVNQTLFAVSPGWKAMAKVAARQLNLLPPAAAMAGIYTAVDDARGVWKAPANVSVNSVTSPAVSISNDEQAALNVDPTGKSINLIRSFTDEGVLVWGARTLDGNSLDWRYINVRRTMIFLEESCHLAAKQMVFEPNVASTWVTVRAMISNFLNTIWRQGGLAGAAPEDAYSVHCGLGATMTPNDILEGYLRVTVLVAITRPAEFIEITFQQQMQKS